jgi:hypothetical protein
LSRARVIHRLRGYWQMEAANALLVPGAAFAAVIFFGGGVSWPTALAGAACAALLVIGALAWRMELASLEGKPAVARYWTPILAAAQPWALLATVASVAAVGWRLVTFGDLWAADAIAAAVLAALTAAEYVNYYHVQLQHFDNAADFKRLLRGRGFRTAHLARAIAAWKAKQKG